MIEKKDPAIKLFGRTIQLGSNSDEHTTVASKIELSTATVTAQPGADGECSSSCQSMLCSKQSENRGHEEDSIGNPMDAYQEEEEPSSSSALDESKTRTSPSTISENPKTFSNDKESSSQNLSKEDQSDQTSNTHSQDQSPLKKPDKILPCPRCSSMDTKFCYFNNYNVNQPRHFCKNCQRYWTAGGTMRNVPVGAGRRKNKSSSSSQHRHLVIPELPNELIQHGLRPNGTVLAFGSDSPLPKSMASSLKLVNQKSLNCVPNGFIEQDMSIPICFGGSMNGNENSSSLSNDNSISMRKGGNGVKVTSQEAACFSGSSWPYTWNPIPWQSGFPVSFFSAQPYLAGNTPGTWNMPWLSTPSVCTDQSSTTSSPDSTSLGKHSREEPTDEKRSGNTRIVIPKTLRIDDPNEAAKSSIWDTLGIKNDNIGSPMKGGFFRGLQQSKNTDHVNGKQSTEGSSIVLHANPAAFSRALSFQEIAQ